MDIIEDLPNEEWRSIRDYSRYAVSNRGRIKSFKHANTRLLTSFVNNKGYARVALCKDGQPKYYLVSRLVAEAFCQNDNPLEKTVVDHIDNNHLNNNAENLRWLSPSENTKEYFRRRSEKNDGRPIS